MDITGRARLAGVPPERIFGAVSDLTTYPKWLGIVRSVEPDDDGWYVEVGAKVGTFWRTKRVRMAKAHEEPPSSVRFERAERDGRAHSAWVLAAQLQGSSLDMHLHYGGSMWVPFLDRILQNEIRRAGGRLERLLT